MKTTITSFILLSLFLFANASRVRMVTRTDVMNIEYDPLFYQGDAIPSTEKHTIHFAIAQKENAAAVCDSLINKLADPENFTPSWLTLDQTRKIFQNKESLSIVENWLQAEKIPFTTSLSGDFVSVTTSIGKIEKLLSTKFFYFHSTFDARVVKRAESYSLPEHIAKHVDFVSHTINYPPFKTRFLSEKVQQSSGVTPSTINQVYGISSNNVNNQGATQSLFEALGQDFSPADLTTFQQQYNLPQFAVGNVIGPNDPTQCSSNPNNCGEANLDVQYIMSVAQNAPTTYWSIDPNSNDPFIDWIIALGNTQNPPLVHSISYGSIAREEDSQNVFRFNTEACKLGLRGITIVVASGDDGVANFLARNNASACGFSPSFPATSQYVTSVGATQGPESGQPEIACTSATGGIVTSGGGFSIYFSRPSWQAAAVQNYLNNGPNLPPLNMFASNNRAYPDVSALGFNYNVVLGGQTYQESGTSASTPTFAGMLTLINNARLNAGKGPLGFVTPALYKFAQSQPNVFHDITSGENNCAAGQAPSIVCCQYGFNATIGFDPITGLGSPNFPNLKSALLSL